MKTEITSDECENIVRFYKTVRSCNDYWNIRNLGLYWRTMCVRFGYCEEALKRGLKIVEERIKNLEEING